MVESWVGAMSALLPRAIHEAGHEFTLVTRDLHHYVRRGTGGQHPLLSARHILHAETNDLDSLFPWLDGVREALGFDGVISSCDYYLPAVAQIAARYDLPGPRPEAVAASLHKDQARTAFAAAGLPGPAVRAAEGWDAVQSAAVEIGYPLVTKPVDLCGGMLVRRVDDDAGLRAAYDVLASSTINSRQQRRRPVVLLEELLTGPEVSIESVTIGTKTHVVGVTDKSVVGNESFVETGHMFPAGINEAKAAELADIARAAVAAVGLTDCVSHLEVKLTPAGPRIVELNPRPGGNRISELVRRVTGIDLTLAHAQLTAGEVPDLDPRETGLRSAAVQMLLPPCAGTIHRVRGAESLNRPEVVESVLPEVGTRAHPPADINCYVGRVMVVDATGGGARHLAEQLADGIEVLIESDPVDDTA